MLIVLFFAAGCGKRSTDDWARQLKDPDVVKRRQAIRELSAKTSDSAKVVPALTEALKDENGYVRHDAAIALGKFAREAKSSVPALIQAMSDSEANVRIAAKTSLKKIDPDAAREATP
jgi:HEAT repeat protein